MDEFAGKVVLITGAGRGLGREIALAFSCLGACVAANDINPVNLDGTVSQILQNGGTARAYVFDIAKRMPIEGMVNQVLEHYGRIDVLVNHASVKPHAPLLDMDEWDFHRTLDVNLGGPFFCIQQVGRVMRQQGSGAIVNIISKQFDIPRQLDLSGQLEAQKGHSAHFASQSGLVGLTQAAAVELGGYNIRLNAVDCSLNAAHWVAPPGWEAAAFEAWQSAISVTWPGEQPHLVSLVLYLCSQAASITGQVIPGFP